MITKEKINYLRWMLSCALKTWNKLHAPEFETNRLLGEIIRHTHSIEKGLSLNHVRMGFGLEKIKLADQAIGKLNLAWGG